jgi:hypothetical protein
VRFMCIFIHVGPELFHVSRNEAEKIKAVASDAQSSDGDLPV